MRSLLSVIVACSVSAGLWASELAVLVDEPFKLSVREKPLRVQVGHVPKTLNGLTVYFGPRSDALDPPVQVRLWASRGAAEDREIISRVSFYGVEEGVAHQVYIPVTGSVREALLQPQASIEIEAYALTALPESTSESKNAELEGEEGVLEERGLVEVQRLELHI